MDPTRQAISECYFRMSRQAIKNVTRGYMDSPCDSAAAGSWKPAAKRSPRGAQPLVRQLVNGSQFLFDAPIQLEGVQTRLLSLQSCQRFGLALARVFHPRQRAAAPGDCSLVPSTDWRKPAGRGNELRAVVGASAGVDGGRE
jgi:hypothetical protein